MHETGVAADESAKRLQGLALSRDGKLAGLNVLLSDAGLKDRAGTVADLGRELSGQLLARRTALRTAARIRMG